MKQIPLQAIPNQLVTTVLAEQLTRINVYQLATGLYCDIYVGNVVLVGGVVCQNINRLVRDADKNFTGDLIFMDTEGTDDPHYSGLGGRFQLLYLETSDLP